MLKKAMIASIKEFHISIGSMSNCTVTLSKENATAGEVITVTVHASAGYGNAKVSVTGAQVTQMNDTTFTFVMPFSDVVVSATASVLEFAIYVNQSGTGTVSVKQTARYGETVSITVSPGGGFRLSSIWGDGASVSGSGNNYSFVMPANNVTIHVAFEDMRVVLTCGRVVGESGIPGYNHIDGTVGSLNRVPYWESRDKYLSQFFARWDWHTKFHLGSNINRTQECSFKTIYVNGQPFTLSGGGGTQRSYHNEGNNKLGLRDGMVITLIFDPPPYWIPVRKSSRYLPALERRAW